MEEKEGGNRMKVSFNQARQKIENELEKFVWDLSSHQSKN